MYDELLTGTERFYMIKYSIIITALLFLYPHERLFAREPAPCGAEKLLIGKHLEYFKDASRELGIR